MRFIKKYSLILAGLLAGTVNGLLGTGGGMILVPLMTSFSDLQEDQIFPTSVSIILPICIISLLFSYKPEALTFSTILPYLLGSVAGGLLCGFFGKKIPVKWLHRFLGFLILWGGIRYLC